MIMQSILGGTDSMLNRRVLPMFVLDLIMARPKGPML